MRIYLLAAGAMLACTACMAAQATEPDVSQVTENVAADNPDCRDYKATATVDGTEQQIVGRACRQQDGTWKITEGPPARPAEYGAVYVPPAYGYYPSYGYYPAYDPWFWGPPIGLSLGAFVFVDRDHHIHRFHGFRHFASPGFHRFHNFPPFASPGFHRDFGRDRFAFGGRDFHRGGFGERRGFAGPGRGGFGGGPPGIAAPFAGRGGHR
jgi:hypothetical protein